MSVSERIPSTLFPENSLDLLKYLQICSISFKILILASTKALHSRDSYRTDELYQGLTDCVHTFVKPHMAQQEPDFAVYK